MPFSRLGGFFLQLVLTWRANYLRSIAFYELVSRKMKANFLANFMIGIGVFQIGFHFMREIYILRSSKYVTMFGDSTEDVELNLPICVKIKIPPRKIIIK